MVNVLSSLAFLAAAAPLVFSQSVTLLYPSGVTWYAGQEHNVTWGGTLSGTFTVQLQLTKSGDLSSNGAFAPTNGTYNAGRLQVTVPHVQGGSDYAWLLTVFPAGDLDQPYLILGNDFTIINNSPSTSSFLSGSALGGSLTNKGTPPPVSSTSSASFTSTSTPITVITTIETTNSAGSTTEIVSTISETLGTTTETGGVSTIVTTNSAGSTITTVSTSSFASSSITSTLPVISGGTTEITTNSAGSSVTTVVGGSTITSSSSSGSTTSSGTGSTPTSPSSSGTSSSSSSTGSSTGSSGAAGVRPLGGGVVGVAVAVACALLGSALVL